MKRLIHSQRFGMIAEICDRIATAKAAQLIKWECNPNDIVAITLKVRLDTEIELNGATDEAIIEAYEKVICDR